MSDGKLKSFRDLYSIRQGRIQLYRRTFQGTQYQSDSWYAYFKIPGEKPIRRSLKTSDKLEAESLAENQYFELVQKSKKGISLKSKQFIPVANAYLRDCEERVIRESSRPQYLREYKPKKLKSSKLIIEKFLIPFFKDKSLQEITDFDIESYKEWRRTYWISGEGSKVEQVTYSRNGSKVTRPKRAQEKKEPAYSTINKDLIVLREVFEYARLKQMIHGKEIPVIKNLKRPRNLRNRKSGLSPHQVRHLLETLANRYYQETHYRRKRHLKLVIHYIAFMCLTGVRVTEAKSLRIRDCEVFSRKGKDYLKIFVRGKGQSRELIGLQESGTTLQKIVTYHRENSKKNGWEYSDDLPVFVDQYGTPIKSFAGSVDRGLADAGLLYDKHGLKRTAGAFRKYYITTALLSGVDYFQLAKQCGTSVSVIEQYYSELETFHQPEKFVFSHALAGVYSDQQH